MGWNRIQFNIQIEQHKNIKEKIRVRFRSR